MSDMWMDGPVDNSYYPAITAGQMVSITANFILFCPQEDILIVKAFILFPAATSKSPSRLVALSQPHSSKKKTFELMFYCSSYAFRNMINISSNSAQSLSLVSMCQ